MEFKFVPGIEPRRKRARELQDSEKKSHVAKVVHRRRMQSCRPPSCTSHTQLKNWKDRISTLPIRDTHCEGTFANTIEVQLNNGDIQPLPNNQFGLLFPRNSVRSFVPKLEDGGELSESSHGIEQDQICHTKISYAMGLWPMTAPFCFPLQPSLSQYGSSEKARSFEIWSEKVAPFLGRGRSSYHDVVNTLIPQRAMSSGVVSDILMAYAIAHQNHILKPFGTEKQPSQKVAPYLSRAVTSVWAGGASLIDQVIVLYLAWAIEGLQGNTATSTEHLKACKALLCFDQSEKNIQRIFQPLLLNAVAVQQSTSTRSVYPLLSSTDHEQRLGSSHRIGRLPATLPIDCSIPWLLSYILQARSSRGSDFETRIHDGIGPWLEYWIETRLSSEQDGGTESDEREMQVVFDLVCALLPHHIIYDILNPADGLGAEKIAGKIEQCLYGSEQMPIRDRFQTLATLRLVVILCLKSCRQSVHSVRFRALEQMLSAQHAHLRNSVSEQLNSPPQSPPESPHSPP